MQWFSQGSWQPPSRRSPPTPLSPGRSTGRSPSLPTLTVTANGCPVKNLNELEWIDGQIYANIWQTDLIARIDPKSGKVTSFLDVNALKPGTANQDEVANGIAYDAAGKRIFVTGKHWPKMYEVRQGAKKEPSEAATALMTCAK